MRVPGSSPGGGDRQFFLYFNSLKPMNICVFRSVCVSHVAQAYSSQDVLRLAHEFLDHQVQA